MNGHSKTPIWSWHLKTLLNFHSFQDEDQIFQHGIIAGTSKGTYLSLGYLPATYALLAARSDLNLTFLSNVYTFLFGVLLSVIFFSLLSFFSWRTPFLLRLSPPKSLPVASNPCTIWLRCHPMGPLKHLLYPTLYTGQWSFVYLACFPIRLAISRTGTYSYTFSFLSAPNTGLGIY